jgi:type IV secretory pathway VirD2 relaxase
LLHENDSTSLNNRNASKVTFESFVTQTSVSSSPKTKDQGVMVQIDLKGQLNYSNTTHEQVQNSNEIKNGRISLSSEVTGIGTSGFNSAKSSVREILQNQKATTRRKSKSQNRARKALRTITFILGMFQLFH